MVGGYQLISLKDYVFDLTDEGTSQVPARTEDINIFKNLLNINKPIICKDIIVKISENTIEKFDNVLLLKYDYISTVDGAKQNVHYLIGLLYDSGDTFSNKQAQLSIFVSGDDVMFSLSKEEDI